MSSLSSIVPAHLLPSRFSHGFVKAMTENQHVNIIGAGLGGLALGRALKQHGIAARLYDKSNGLPRHDYGITLNTGLLSPLSNILETEGASLGRYLAVNSAIESQDTLHSAPGLRLNRGRLESLLSKGLDINYSHAAEGAEETASGTSVRLRNGELISDGVLVVADGVHSAIRKSLIPSAVPNVLPVVAFNGKRSISTVLFETLFKPAMTKSTVVAMRRSEVLLTVYVNYTAPAEVGIGWIYSRLSRPANDALHKPERAHSGATDIPQAFYDEVAQLENLPGPFKAVFESDTLRNDRILHWLMRTTAVPEEDLLRLASKNVFFIGDAVHAQPIIGGNGGNEALADGLQLADALAKGGVDEARAWYRSRMPTWKVGVEESSKVTLEMHAVRNDAAT